MRPSVYTLIALILLLPSAAHAQKTLDQGVEELSQKIAAQMTAKQKKTLAVVEFVEVSGSESDFGPTLVEELTNHLHRTGAFVLVERERLNQVMREQKNSLTPFFDQNSAQQLGKLLNVDAIVSGTVSEFGPQYLRIYSRVIDVKTAEIYATVSVDIYKDKSVLQLLNSKSKREVGSTLRPDSGGQQQAHGDEVRILFKEAWDLADKHKYTEAEAKFRRVLELDHNNFKYYIGLAWALYNQEKVSEAIEQFRNASILSPKSAEAHFGLGLSLERQNKLEAALAELRQAADLSPDNKDYQVALERVQTALNQE